MSLGDPSVCVKVELFLIPGLPACACACTHTHSTNTHRSGSGERTEPAALYSSSTMFQADRFKEKDDQRPWTLKKSLFFTFGTNILRHGAFLPSLRQSSKSGVGGDGVFHLHTRSHLIPRQFHEAWKWTLIQAFWLPQGQAWLSQN